MRARRHHEHQELEEDILPYLTALRDGHIPDEPPSVTEAILWVLIVTVMMSVFLYAPNSWFIWVVEALADEVTECVIYIAGAIAAIICC